MDKNFEDIGFWWLPNSENEAEWAHVTGTIKFSPSEGAKLQLFGHLIDSEYFANNAEYDLLCGVTISGKLITLQKCRQYSFEYPSPGVPVRTFSVEIVYEGVHFNNSDEIRFTSIEVEYTNLHNWVGRSAFEIDDSARERIGFGTTIHIDPPERIEWLAYGSSSVAIDFGIKKIPAATWSERRSLAIEQSTYVEIKDATPEVFTQRHIMLYYIHSFLSLAMLNPVYMTSLRGFIGANKEHKIINIYYKQLRTYADTEEITANRMFFTFNRLGAHAGTALSQWIDRGTTLHSLYDMYFATMYASSMYLEHRFLSMVQACESYSRLKRNSKKKFIFRTGIKSLIDRLTPASLITISDQNQFLDMVQDSRNYYTHRNVNEIGKATKGQELVWITNELKRFIEIFFLLEIGLNITEIETMVRQ